MREMFWLDSKPSMLIRILARGIDYAILYLIFSLCSLIFPYYVEDLYYLGFASFVPVLWVPIEALLISKTKTTPGKSLFGIRVETHLASKLPFLISLKRACFLGIRPGIIRQKKVGKLRVFAGIILFFSLFGGSFFEKEITVATTGFEKYKAVEGWKEYTPVDGKFTVIFPHDPKHETGILPVPSQNKNLSYEEFKSYQTKKVYYSVSYIDLPKKWKIVGSNKLLLGAMDMIVSHTPDAKLVNQGLTKHKNLRALDFHMVQGDEEIKGRLILVGTTLFRLTAVYPPALAHQLQHQEFVNSFEIHG